MPTLLSPNVVVTERDLTAVIPSVSTSTGAIAIDAVWGPVSVPTTVDSETTLVSRFGKPQAGNAPNWLTAANFLSYSTNLLVTRTDTTLQRNAVAQLSGQIVSIPVTNGGSAYVQASTVVNIPAPTTAGGIQATATAVVSGGVIQSITITNAGSGYDTVPVCTITGVGSAYVLGTTVTTQGGVKINNDDTYLLSYSNGEGIVGNWAAKYPGSIGNSLTVSQCDSGSWTNWAYKSQFNSSPGTSDWTNAIGGSNDEMHVVVVDTGGKFSGTAGTVLEKFAYVSKAADAKYGDGTSSYYKNAINVNSKYVRWMDHQAMTSAGNALGSSGVTGAYANLLNGTVQAGTITTTTSGTAVTGVGTAFAATDVGKLLYTVQGTYIGTIATYTSATAVVLGANAAVALTGGQYQTTYSTGTITCTTASASITGTTTQFTAADVGKVIYNAAGVALGTISTYTSATAVTLSANAAVAVTGGPFSLSSPITLTLVGGVDHLTSTDAQKMAAYQFYDNAEQYDISLIMAGKANATVANFVIQNIAQTRTDCVAFVSPEDISTGASLIGTDSTVSDSIIAYRNLLTSSSYGVCDTGVKYQYDRYNDTFRWVPLNGDVAGLCARTDYTNDAWWSPAGFNRGQINNVVKLGFNPRPTDRDNLYKAGVNPVVAFPGQGVILYGDKTLQAKPSAFDRINVRRLFITLEKAISIAAKYQLFEFNDPFTRAQFIGTVTPFLRDVQGRRGIIDFRVVCDESNNTQQVIDTNSFIGDIYIKPTRSINFLQLNFIATKTGVSFSSVAGGSSA